ncbi:hypothetical protein [Parasphingorhabdus pacifica]
MDESDTLAGSFHSGPVDRQSLTLLPGPGGAVALSLTAAAAAAAAAPHITPTVVGGNGRWTERVPPLG